MAESSCLCETFTTQLLDVLSLSTYTSHQLHTLSGTWTFHNICVGQGFGSISILIVSSIRRAILKMMEKFFNWDGKFFVLSSFKFLSATFPSSTFRFYSGSYALIIVKQNWGFFLFQFQFKLFFKNSNVRKMTEEEKFWIETTGVFLGGGVKFLLGEPFTCPPNLGFTLTLLKSNHFLRSLFVRTGFEPF